MSYALKRASDARRLERLYNLQGKEAFATNWLTICTKRSKALGCRALLNVVVAESDGRGSGGGDSCRHLCECDAHHVACRICVGGITVVSRAIVVRSLQLTRFL